MSGRRLAASLGKNVNEWLRVANVAHVVGIISHVERRAINTTPISRRWHSTLDDIESRRRALEIAVDRSGLYRAIGAFSFVI